MRWSTLPGVVEKIKLAQFVRQLKRTVEFFLQRAPTTTVRCNVNQAVGFRPQTVTLTVITILQVHLRFNGRFHGHQRKLFAAKNRCIIRSRFRGFFTTARRYQTNPQSLFGFFWNFASLDIISTMTTRVIFNKKKEDTKRVMTMAYAVVIEETKPGTNRLSLTKSKLKSPTVAKTTVANRITTMNIAHIIMPSSKQVYATMRLNEVRFGSTLLLYSRMISCTKFQIFITSNRYDKKGICLSKFDV